MRETDLDVLVKLGVEQQHDEGSGGGGEEGAGRTGRTRQGGLTPCLHSDVIM